MSKKEVLAKGYISASLDNSSLIQHLKKLHEYLGTLDQDSANSNAGTSSLNDIASSLAKNNIINHKNKDVRLLSACCLAELIRIYAPVPPFNQAQTIAVFKLIIEQIKGVADQDDANFPYFFSLLEKMSSVHAFILLFEVDAFDLIVDVIDMCYSIVSEDTKVGVLNCLTDIVVCIVEQLDTPTSTVMDVVLSPLRPQKRKENPSASNFSTEVLKNVKNLQTVVSQYVTALRQGTLTESELSGNVYELVYELHKISPEYNLFILPQFEEDLKVDDEKSRSELVLLLAKLFSTQRTLSLTYVPLFASFLQRFHDKSYTIRAYMIEFGRRFLLSVLNNTETNVSVSSDVESQLVARLCDLDERVRRAAVCALGDISSALALAGKCSFGSVGGKGNSKGDALAVHKMAERLLDRKPLVRRETISRLGVLYQSVSARYGPTHSQWSQSVQRIAGWVPERLLTATFTLPHSDKMLIEKTIDEVVLPDTKLVADRTRSLLGLIGALSDERAENALSKLLAEREELNECVRVLYECLCKKESVKSQIVTQAITTISRCVPTERVVELTKRLYKSKGAQKVFSQLQKLSQHNVGRKESANIVKSLSVLIAQIDSSLTNLVEEIATKAHYRIVSPQIVKKVIEILCDLNKNEKENEESESESEETLENGLRFLRTLSNSAPSLLVPHLSTLSAHINTTSLQNTTTTTLSSTALSALSACANMVFRGQSLVSESKESLKTLTTLTKMTETSKHANGVRKCIRAMRVLCTQNTYENKMKTLVNFFLKRLDAEGRNSPQALPSFSGICLALKLCPNSFENSQIDTLSKYTPNVTNLTKKQRLKSLKLYMKLLTMLIKIEVNLQNDSAKKNQNQNSSSQSKSKSKTKTKTKTKNNERFNEELNRMFSVLVSLIDSSNALYDGLSLTDVEVLAQYCCGCVCVAAKWVPNLLTFDVLETIVSVLKDTANITVCRKIYKHNSPISLLSVLTLAGSIHPINEDAKVCKGYLAQTIALRLQTVKLLQSENRLSPAQLSVLMPEYSLPYLILILAHQFYDTHNPSLPIASRVLSTFLSCFTNYPDSNALMLRIARGLCSAIDEIDGKLTEQAQTVSALAVLHLERVTANTSKGEVFMPSGLFSFNEVLPNKIGNGEQNKKRKGRKKVQESEEENENEIENEIENENDEAESENEMEIEVSKQETMKQKTPKQKTPKQKTLKQKTPKQKRKREPEENERSEENEKETEKVIRTPKKRKLSKEKEKNTKKSALKEKKHSKAKTGEPSKRKKKTNAK